MSGVLAEQAKQVDLQYTLYRPPQAAQNANKNLPKHITYEQKSQTLGNLPSLTDCVQYKSSIKRH